MILFSMMESLSISREFAETADAVYRGRAPDCSCDDEPDGFVLLISNSLC